MGWVKLSDDFPNHGKVLPLSAPAKWLYVVGLCYCAQALTDGAIPDAAVRPLLLRAGARRPHVEELVGAGLWHDDAHECEACPPVGEGVHVHDYLHFNPTRDAEVARRSRERIKKAMQRQRGSVGVEQGGDGRWLSPGDSPRDTPGESPATRTRPRTRPPTDVSNPFPKDSSVAAGVGDGFVPKSADDPLVARVIESCAGRQRRRVEAEAVDVVAYLRDYVDDRLIDGCVEAAIATGAVLPRWYLAAVRAAAAPYRITVPPMAGLEDK